MSEPTMINFAGIEKKWQERWEQEKAFDAAEAPTHKKHYLLEMFPYPSGSGLHMGHALNYTIGDIQARLKRMQGFSVLYPMGYDSFGLPAENAAIKNKIHPQEFTDKSVQNFIRQQKELGLSYDWNRMLKTSDPDYYKWNQYFFLKFLEKGLAYRKKSSVNWCPDCNTVLANEQVHSGKCWRHETTDVETKELEQWFLKTTTYADELLDNVEALEWPERIKIMQRNWIGRKEWIDIQYSIKGSDETITVSTTRPDTNFGATFIVIAPEHSLLSKETNLIPTEQRAAVDEYIRSAAEKTDDERIEEGRTKTGVFTGLYCINPLTNKEMPVWVTDFVLTTVGTGAVVGVPGHDLRDFEFAQTFDLPIVRVVVGSDGDTSDITRKEQVQEKEGTMINSDFLNGLDIHKATGKIMDYLEEKGWGKRTMRYRLRDWLISRQRYWGTPIPIIYCDACGVVPVPEKDLPVTLPEDVTFGEGNPLETNETFLTVDCPTCGGRARRETDTMDTFFDSSWYFLRYLDNYNNEKPFDAKKVNSWMPVDQYIGGAEHACMHLIYARFFTKALRDLGYVGIDEPFTKLFNQGMLHGDDGHVMSKSRGNVVLPEDVSKSYGIDTARLFLVSVAAPDKDITWSEKSIEGSLRFILNVFDFIARFKEAQMSPLQESIFNRLHKEYTDDLLSFKYNLAVIKLRDLFDVIREGCDKKALHTFLQLLSPICPHIAEELWEQTNGDGLISLSSWPEPQEEKINEKLEQQAQQVTKTIGDIKNILQLIEEKQNKEATHVYLYVLPQEKEMYSAERLTQTVGKQVSVYAVNDEDKHDPEEKSKKVKPGRPGIYVE